MSPRHKIDAVFFMSCVTHQFVMIGSGVYREHMDQSSQQKIFNSLFVFVSALRALQNRRDVDAADIVWAHHADMLNAVHFPKPLADITTYVMQYFRSLISPIHRLLWNVVD